MRDAAGDLTGSRVAHCGKRPLPDRFVTVMQREDGGCYFGNTRKCGSVHECPVCAARIASVRAGEIRSGLLEALDQGLFVQAVVPTIRHERGDALDHLLGVLKGAWRSMFSGRAGKELRSRLGIVGQIRADEVTYGARTGWHPHMHVLLITSRPLSPSDGWDLFERFRWGVEREGGFTSEEAWAGGYQEIASAGGIADYLVKLEKLVEPDSWSAAEELAFAHIKAGRKRADAAGWSDQVRLSPWELLERFSETGDMELGDLFREYAAAYRGKSRLQWSPGLKKRLKIVHSVSDVEAAQDQAVEDAEQLAIVESSDWKLVVRYDARLTLLEAAEEFGSIGVEQCLEWLRDVRLAEMGVVHPGRSPSTSVYTPA